MEVRAATTIRDTPTCTVIISETESLVEGDMQFVVDSAGNGQWYRVGCVQSVDCGNGITQQRAPLTPITRQSVVDHIEHSQEVDL